MIFFSDRQSVRVSVREAQHLSEEEVQHLLTSRSHRPGYVYRQHRNVIKTFNSNNSRLNKTGFNNRIRIDHLRGGLRFETGLIILLSIFTNIIESFLVIKN